jgi:hypothetical protein
VSWINVREFLMAAEERRVGRNLDAQSRPYSREVSWPSLRRFGDMKENWGSCWDGEERRAVKVERGRMWETRVLLEVMEGKDAKGLCIDVVGTCI